MGVPHHSAMAIRIWELETSDMHLSLPHIILKANLISEVEELHLARGVKYLYFDLVNVDWRAFEG